MWMADHLFDIVRKPVARSQHWRDGSADFAEDLQEKSSDADDQNGHEDAKERGEKI